MNLQRMAAAAVLAWIVALAYSFVVYGNLMASEFARYPGVFRSAHQTAANVPFLLVGSLIAMVVAVHMYGKGYEGGSGLVEGARFGALLGVYAVGAAWVGEYVSLNIGGRLALYGAIAAFVESVIVGAIIGVIYKPAVARRIVHV